MLNFRHSKTAIAMSAPPDVWLRMSFTLQAAAIRLDARHAKALAGILLGLAQIALPGAVQAEQVTIAVAANFTAPLKTIVAQFEKDTAHKVAVSSGATGKFYAQIKSGAPFDVFLSADGETPARLDKEGNAVAGSRFTYAVGRLALWSATPGFVDAQGEVLKARKFASIALAAPKLAPYGAAAVETLNRLGLLAALEPKFVIGESIGQAYSFVATGNAALGFVALSQVFEDGKIKTGSAWIVPANLHSPLRQDAVLLTRGKGNKGAAEFIRFLKTDTARAVIRSYGYESGQ
jgi:molybdate transport system substrate-binding protein